MSARPPRRTAVLTEATSYTLHLGDCLEVLRTLSDASVDAVVTDPPYELGFMGKGWDASGIAFNPEVWRECLRVLKPGGHLLAFGGTRTYHRMTVAIEDAGFEIRDGLSWQYGSGFPKSLNVSKAIDANLSTGRSDSVALRVRDGREAGTVGTNMRTHRSGKNDNAQGVDTAPLSTDDAKRWTGWGTALKPAWEPIVVARKPLEGTVAANVLRHGTGALNIDGCRVPTAAGDEVSLHGRRATDNGWDARWSNAQTARQTDGQALGRWPANLILSHGADCEEGECAPGCPCAALDAQSEGASRYFAQLPIDAGDLTPFLYAPKASRSEREAGCDALPSRDATETVDRDIDAAGAKSPRAGANRGAGAPLYYCSACGVSLQGGRAGAVCTKAEDGKHVPEAKGVSPTVRNHHPTVKPVSVMRWCARLVTPPGGVVLDPFMGSGTTGIAAENEGFRFIGIERELEYIAIAKARIAHARPSMDVSQKTE